MTSAISYTNITTTYPIPGRDNDSQGFRTNFSEIKAALETAANEISLLQSTKADLISSNVFTNITPSYSTNTGAIVVAGGVGIGGALRVNLDSYVGTGKILTTSTPFLSTTSDVIVSGTYKDPTFTISGTLTGNKQFRGGVSVIPTSTSSGLVALYVSTTATSQTAIYGTLRHSLGSALTLNNDSDSGSTLRNLIKLVANNNTILTVYPDGTTTVINGIVTFKGGPVTFDPTITTNFSGTNVISGTTTISGPTTLSGTTTVTGPTIITSSTTISSPGFMTFNTRPVLSSLPPTTATSTGVAGQIAWDSNYVYVCVATDTWKRSPISTW